jgi:hypothetical protein
MQSYPVDLTVKVTLDGSGNGTAQIGPNSGKWALGLISVSTLASAPKVASCTIYAGSASTATCLIDQTYNAFGNSTNKAAGKDIYQGQNVFAVFTGGNAGDTASLRVTGQRISGYR